MLIMKLKEKCESRFFVRSVRAMLYSVFLIHVCFVTLTASYVITGEMSPARLVGL